MTSEYARLAKRLRTAFEDLERTIARAEMMRDKAIRANDDAYWDGAALNMQSFYTGVEQIFVDIAQLVDENMPSGSQWHQVLLAQMSNAVTDARPAVIMAETRARLEEYLKFRHVVRNVYAFNLRPDRLEELVGNLRSCLNAVTMDFNTFAAFLDQLDQPDT